MRAGDACTPNSSFLRRTIQDVAKYLGAEETRRKAFVVLTESIAPGDNCGLFETMQPWGWTRTEIELVNMMEALRRANASLYAIDPRGRLRTPEERSRESRGANNVFRMLDPQYWSQETLKLTAEASGGFAIVDTNESQSGLSRVIADLDNYYMLGFYPKDPTDKSWHKLEVASTRTQNDRTPSHLDTNRAFHRDYPKSKDPLRPAIVGGRASQEPISRCDWRRRRSRCRRRAPVSR